MENNQELIKQLIATAVRFKYGESPARHKNTVLSEAIAIKNALRGLYPISVEQGQSVLEHVGTYAAVLAKEPRVTERYFVGEHDSGAFPDVLLIMECEEAAGAGLPNGPRTYYEIGLEEFLERADGTLEIRRVRKPLPDWRASAYKAPVARETVPRAKTPPVARETALLAKKAPTAPRAKKTPTAARGASQSRAKARLA